MLQKDAAMMWDRPGSATAPGGNLPQRSRSFFQLARFPRNFSALLSRFRETDSDSLLARSYLAAFSAFAGIKRAALFSVHRALHTLTRSFPVFPSRTFFC